MYINDVKHESRVAQAKLITMFPQYRLATSGVFSFMYFTWNAYCLCSAIIVALWDSFHEDGGFPHDFNCSAAQRDLSLTPRHRKVMILQVPFVPRSAVHVHPWKSTKTAFCLLLSVAHR